MLYVPPSLPPSLPPPLSIPPPPSFPLYTALWTVFLIGWYTIYTFWLPIRIELSTWCSKVSPLPGGGGGEGYQARPKIHVIRIVFQDQALYVCTSFRGAKNVQNWKKGCVFGHIDKFWKEHDRQNKKNACKNLYLWSFFIPEKYMIRVLFVNPWMSLIPPPAIWVPPWSSSELQAFVKCLWLL